MWCLPGETSFFLEFDILLCAGSNTLRKKSFDDCSAQVITVGDTVSSVKKQHVAVLHAFMLEWCRKCDC